MFGDLKITPSDYFLPLKAKPSEMAKRDGNFIQNTDRKALYFGFSNLHVKMRTFDWGNIGCGVSNWRYKIIYFMQQN